MPITLLICANERCLGGENADALCAVARERLHANNLRGEVFPVKCLDLCQRGPHVVIHGAEGAVPDEARSPDGGVAYDEVTPATLALMVDEHCARGAPLTASLHRDRPGRSRAP